MTALFIYCAACSRWMCRKESAVTSQDAGTCRTRAEDFNIILHSLRCCAAHSLIFSHICAVMAEDLYATRTSKLIGANIVLILLSGIAVALRFWSRKISRVGFWYDDYTILLALLPAWMMPMLNLIGRSIILVLGSTSLTFIMNSRPL